MKFIWNMETMERASNKTTMLLSAAILLVIINFVVANSEVKNQQEGRCDYSVVTGSCSAAIPRWNYDCETKTCNQFFYSGCGGNENNHETRDICETTCFDYTCKDGKNNGTVTVGRSVAGKVRRGKKRRRQSGSASKEGDSKESDSQSQEDKSGSGKRQKLHHKKRLDRRHRTDKQKWGSKGKHQNKKGDRIEGF